MNKYESHYHDAPGGRIHYLHRPNPGKPVLLGLHGFKDTARTFVFLEPLLEPNFELYFLDWPGHGESNYLKEGYYSSARFFGDLTSFTGQVLPDRYYLMGHSMGAAFSARFAGTFPDETLGLVLLEGFAGLVSPEVEAERLRTWARDFRGSLQEGRQREHRKLPDIQDVRYFLTRLHKRLTEERAAVMADLLTRPAPDGDGLVWAHDPLLDQRFVPLFFPPLVSRTLWKAVSCPVLLLFGQKTRFRPDDKAFQEALAAGAKFDRDASPEHAHLSDALREIVNNFKTLEFHDIEGAGHNPHHDKPEAVMEIMATFFKKLGLEIV